jgi:hypothetical protein
MILICISVEGNTEVGLIFGQKSDQVAGKTANLMEKLRPNVEKSTPLRWGFG